MYKKINTYNLSIQTFFKKSMVTQTSNNSLK